MIESIFKQVGNDFFVERNGDFSQKLPPGIYKASITPDYRVYFSKLDPVTDNLVDVEGSIHEEIIADVEKFTTEETKANFKRYGVVHKRGYLLHGRAGTGKTVVAIKAAKKLAEAGGVILFNPSPDLLATCVPLIRQNDSESLIGVIYEEFDDHLRGSQSTLLSVLDGELQVSNFVVIACTNYMSKIPARVKNRPSRFARVIEIGVPEASFRETFFKAKLSADHQDDVAAFVEASDGMVIDQMKDLIISVYCMGETLASATKKIKEMQDNSIGIEDYSESSADEVFAELKDRLKGSIGYKPRLV